jgi:iron(III) transport system permease protein
MHHPWGRRVPWRQSVREPGTILVVVIAATALTASLAVANQRTRPLLLSTLLWAGGSALLSLPVGIVLALLIYRTNFPGRRMLQALMTLLLFVPPYLHVAFWQAGFGLQGWYSRIVSERALTILDGWRGAIWVQTLINIPWVVLFLGAALTSIPTELEEQASLYGTPQRVLRYVTFPLLRPAVVAAALAVFILAAGDITVTDFYQIRTFAEEIYLGFALGDQLQDVPLRTLPGMLLTGGLAMAAMLVCGHVVRNRPGRGGRAWRADWRPAALFVWPLLVVVIITLVVVPLGSLLYQAGVEVTSSGGTLVRHWSAAKALRIILAAPIHFREEYAWSFALAQLTSISVIVAAVLLAWAGRVSVLVRAFAWSIALLGLVLPGPLIALALGRALNRPDSDWMFYLYDRTLVLPWAALSLRVFPFAYLVLDVVMRRIPERTLDLVHTAGAGPVARFRLAVWPHCGPAIGWLWLVLMALTVADLSATILAVPPGVTTVSIRIFNLIHYNVADQWAGLCLGTVMLFGVLAGLVLVFWPWRAEQEDAEI